MWQVHKILNDYLCYTKCALKYLRKKYRIVDIEMMMMTGFWQMVGLKRNHHIARFIWSAVHSFWVRLWWLDQVLSPVLGRFDKRRDEPANYTVSVRRPHVS